MNRQKLYRWLHGGGWTAAVLFLFSLRFIFSRQIPVTPVEIVNWSLYIATAAFLTHRLRLRIRANNWLDLPFTRAWYRYFAATLAIGLVLGTQVTLIGGGWRVIEGAKFPIEFFFSVWINGAFLTLMWIAIYITIVSIRRLAEAKTRALQLELTAKEAHLKNLQAQVNPHFLFNGLNTVRALIAENPAKATEAVTWLAAILRYSLHTDDTKTVTIAEELEMVTQYLALEKLRFEDRLAIHMDIDNAAATARIPPLLLQTLTENAIKHGLSRLPQGGAVTIQIRRENANLQLTVRNTGTLSRQPSPTGIGLKNTRERLYLLYGSAAACELTGANNEVTARVTLPEVHS